MKFIFLYDREILKFSEKIAKLDIDYIHISSGWFWKLRFLKIKSKISRFLVYKSSLHNSLNVKWEISKLKEEDTIYIINDIEDIIDINKIKCKVFFIENTTKSIAKEIKKLETSIGIEGMFPGKIKDEIKKEFAFKMLETSESLINRRQTTNNYLLTANGIIITLICGLFGIDAVRKSILTISFIPLIGIIICISWYSLLESYGKLNKAKFEVIRILEMQLKIPIFSAEWKYLSEKSIAYKSFTKTEKRIPMMFIMIYIVIIAVIIFMFFSKTIPGERRLQWLAIFL
jgi:hypothetical protein